MRRLWGQGTFFRRSFVIVLLIACLPTILIGILTYIFGSKQIEREVNRASDAQQRQAFVRIGDDLNRLESMFSQWAFNPSFDDKLSRLDLRDQFDVTQGLLRTLFQMKTSNALVKDVYLYLQSQDVVMSEAGGVERLEDGEDRAVLERLLKEQQTIYWTAQLKGVHRISGNSAASLVIRIPGGRVTSFGAIVVELDGERVNRMIAERTVTDGGASILLQDDGELLSIGREDPSRATEFERFLVGEVRRTLPAEPSGNRVVEWRSQKYSVTYDTMNRINTRWTYVTASPMEALTRPVLVMSRLIIGISLSVLAAAILLSWLASRRLSQPVQQLLGRLGIHDHREYQRQGLDEFGYIAEQWSSVTRESQLLQERLDRHLPTLREGFLLQLVQGHLDWMNESDIRSRMEQIGWELEGKQFAFLLVQLHGLGKPDSRFAEGDEQLASFAAANVAGDLLREAGMYADVVNFQDLTIGLLVHLPSGLARDEARGELYRLCERLTGALLGVLKLRQTIVVGKPGERLQGISRAVEEARHALRYRSVSDECQWLDLEDLLPVREDGFRYPFDAEREAVGALKAGLVAEAEAAVHRFVGELRGSAKAELQIVQGAGQLLGQLLHTMLQSGTDPYAAIGIDNPQEAMAGLSDPDDIGRWLCERVVRPYLRHWDDSQSRQQERLVEGALQLLQSEYMHDVSLEECAERLGTYPQKLSAAFKQVTGFNFIDYLTQLRLDKAKELLRDTEIKVNDIAEMVGYQPSYFNRLFKKKEGVTPGQYRERALT